MTLASRKRQAVEAQGGARGRGAAKAKAVKAPKRGAAAAPKDAKQSKQVKQADDPDDDDDDESAVANEAAAASRGAAAKGRGRGTKAKGATDDDGACRWVVYVLGRRCGRCCLPYSRAGTESCACRGEHREARQ